MIVQRFNASFSVALVMVLAAPFTAAQKDSASEDCGFGGYGYEQMLDAYFAHARGSSPSAVVLRVYGGLDPEYEIVIDPNISSHSILRYTAKEPIWGKAFDDYMRNHQTAAGCGTADLCLVGVHGDRQRVSGSLAGGQHAEGRDAARQISVGLGISELCRRSDRVAQRRRR